MKRKLSGVLFILIVTVIFLIISIVAADAPTAAALTFGTGADAEYTGSSGGTAVWVADTKTLTLTNFVHSTNAATALSVPDGTEIRLVGDSSVESTYSGGGYSYGIYAYGSLTVGGIGALTATGGEGSRSYGVCTYVSSITVESGSVKGIGKKATDNIGGSYGIHANKITVSGGNLTGISGNATGTYGYSRGVASLNDIIVSNSGRLTGISGEAIYKSYGVWVNGGSITVSGGYLTGFGGKVTDTHGYSYGVYAHSNITTVSNSGSLTGIGGETIGASSYSCGVFTRSDITVSNSSNLAGIGREAGYQSHGVHADGDINIEGGILSGTGGEVTGTNSYSYGVLASGSITISDTGSLTGAGGRTTGVNYGYGYGYSYGVRAGSISASGSGSLTGIGGEATGTYSGDSYGIYARCGTSSSGNITVSDSASLAGAGGEAITSSYGVFTNSGGTTVPSGVITVSGGELTGMGKSAGIRTYTTPVIATGGVVVGGNNSAYIKPLTLGKTSPFSYYSGTKIAFYTKITINSVPSNLNNDDIINMLDLIILINIVSASTDYDITTAKYDINGDGNINTYDVIAMLEYIVSE